MISKTNTHNHFPPLYLPLQFPAPLTGGVRPGCREHSSVQCGSGQNSQTCARLVEKTVAHPPVALLNAEHTPLGVTPHRVGSIFTFSLLLRSGRVRDRDLSWLALVILSVYRVMFPKSTTLFQSFFRNSDALFQGRVGTKADHPGFVSWNCNFRRNSDSHKICILCRPTPVGKSVDLLPKLGCISVQHSQCAFVTHDRGCPEHFPKSPFWVANESEPGFFWFDKSHCGPKMRFKI